MHRSWDIIHLPIRFINTNQSVVSSMKKGRKDKRKINAPPFHHTSPNVRGIRSSGIMKTQISVAIREGKDRHSQA